MSSDESDAEKPPERRAPSGRAGRGNKMSQLIAEEGDEEDEADKDFYKQEFWAEPEDEEDRDFAVDADDEAAHDSIE